MSDRICSVEGCDRPHRARSWCDGHYQRWALQGVEPTTPLKPYRAGGGGPLPQEKVKYIGAHVRVHRLRGKATEHQCKHCGGQAAEWAYDHEDPNELHSGRLGRAKDLLYSVDPAHYIPLCRECHRVFDGAVVQP
jgi:hypothetical protein